MPKETWEKRGESCIFERWVANDALPWSQEDILVLEGAIALGEHKLGHHHYFWHFYHYGTPERPMYRASTITGIEIESPYVSEIAQIMLRIFTTLLSVQKQGRSAHEQA